MKGLFKKIGYTLVTLASVMVILHSVVPHHHGGAIEVCFHGVNSCSGSGHGSSSSSDFCADCNSVCEVCSILSADSHDGGDGCGGLCGLSFDFIPNAGHAHSTGASGGACCGCGEDGDEFPVILLATLPYSLVLASVPAVGEVFLCGYDSSDWSTVCKVLGGSVVRRGPPVVC